MCIMQEVVAQEYNVLRGQFTTGTGVVQHTGVYSDLVVPPVCRLCFVLILAQVVLGKVVDDDCSVLKDC